MTEERMFEINFLKFKVEDFNNKKEKLLNMLKEYPESKKDYQNFYTNRQSDRTGLIQKFREICKDEIEQISKTFKVGFKISDMWSVTYEKGNYHPVHNHGSIGLTGLLYLQADEYASPTIYLQPWTEHITDKTLYYRMPSVEGTIVITPKFLHHFTEPHDAIEDKKVIAFDIDIDADKR